MVTAGPLVPASVGPGLRGAGAIALGVVLVGSFLVGGPTLLGLVVAGLVAVLVTVHFPGVLLVAYLGVAFHKTAVQPFSPIDITLLMAILCMVQIVPLVLDRRPRRLSLAGLFLLVGVAIVIFAGVLYAPDQDIALGRAIDFLLLVWLPFMAITIRVGSEEAYIRQFVYGLLALGIAAVLFGLLQPSSETPLRVWGANTIQTARAVLIVPVLSILLAPTIKSPFIRAGLVLLSMAAAVVALGTGSKGPVIALLLMGGLGAMHVLWTRGLAGNRIVVATAAVAILGFGLLVTGALEVPESAVLRFSIFGEFLQATIEGGAAAGSVTDISSAARIDLFTTAYQMFADAPVVGNGTAAFEAVSAESLGPVGAHVYPHNLFLQFGAELGIIGLAVLVSLIAIAFVRPIPANSYGHIVRTLLVFFLLGAMVTGNAYEERIFWGLLFLLVFMEPRNVPEAPPGSDETEGIESSYLVPTVGLQPSWVQNLHVRGWSWPHRPEPQGRPEPGPYAIGPTEPGPHDE